MLTNAENVLLNFLYSKVSPFVDKDGNVKEEEIVKLDDEHWITVAEAYELISSIEENF